MDPLAARLHHRPAAAVRRHMATCEVFYWLVSEMRPVELITFIAMIMAAVVGTAPCLASA